MQSSSTRIDATKGSRSMLRTITVVILLLLAIQFLIGMLVNLFVTIPSSHPGTKAAEYFSGVVQGDVWALTHGQLPLVLHVITGILLFLGASIVIGLAIASRRRAWIVTAVLGWLGIVTAGFNGGSFLNYGENFSSLLMSIGFLLAVIPYAIGFYITR